MSAIASIPYQSNSVENSRRAVDVVLQLWNEWIPRVNVMKVCRMQDIKKSIKPQSIMSDTSEDGYHRPDVTRTDKRTKITALVRCRQADRTLYWTPGTSRGFKMDEVRGD